MRKPRYFFWENFSKTEVEKLKNDEKRRFQVPTKARANDRPPFSELVSHKTTCCSICRLVQNQIE